MSVSDSLEVRERYKRYLPEHRKKYGNNIIIIGGRLPRNDYLIIDRRFFDKGNIKYNSENLYRELFYSSYKSLGYIDSPNDLKVDSEKNE